METKDNKDTRNSGRTQANPSAPKYETAVARATGAAPAVGAADDASMAMVPLPPSAVSMITSPTQDEINAIMADPKLEFAPQVYSIEEGKMIQGLLEGRGPSTTFEQLDPRTQSLLVREVDTWILKHPQSGYRISILSSVQLDRKLPPFIGSLVSIYRGKKIKTGKGFFVTDYTVSGPFRADGKARSWVRKDVIDAQSRTIDGAHDVDDGGGDAASAAHGGEDAQA